jgi:hypothetical protein
MRKETEKYPLLSAHYLAMPGEDTEALMFEVVGLWGV